MIRKDPEGPRDDLDVLRSTSGSSEWPQQIEKGKKFKFLKAQQNWHHCEEHVTRFPTTKMVRQMEFR
jgi:hypothetical protein